MNHDPGKEVLICECRCGNKWLLDFEPTPEACQGMPWRLGISNDAVNIDWGSWVDHNGNFVDLA